MTKKVLKKYLIIAIISSLIASALVGIFAILLGSFGQIEIKILASTLAVGVFSITSLANLRNIESKYPTYRRFAWLSIIFSIMGMCLTLILIWTNLESNTWKSALILFVLSISTAHVSLLLPNRSKTTTLLNIAVTSTLACITLVAGFLIYLIMTESGNLDEFFYKLLGVFAILDVLGTITVPILARFVHKDTSNPPTDNLNSPSGSVNSQT